MIVEHKIHGSFQIILKPEDEIERVIVEQMVARAAKGQAVTLAGEGQGAVSVSVER